MDSDAPKHMSDCEFHERRARQSHHMVYQASSPMIRKLHLTMAIEHERRAQVSVERTGP